MNITAPRGIKPGWIEFGRYGTTPVTGSLDAAGSDRCVQFGTAHTVAVQQLDATVRATLAAMTTTAPSEREWVFRFHDQDVRMSVTAITANRPLGRQLAVDWSAIGAVLRDPESDELVIEYEDQNGPRLLVLDRPAPRGATAQALEVARDRAPNADPAAELFRLSQGQVVLHENRFVVERFALTALGAPARMHVQLSEVADLARPLPGRATTVDIIPTSAVAPGTVPQADDSVRQLVISDRHLEFANDREADRFIAAVTTRLRTRPINVDEIAALLVASRVPHPPLPTWDQLCSASYGLEVGAIGFVDGRLLFINPHSTVALVREWDLRTMVSARAFVFGEGVASTGRVELRLLTERSSINRLSGADAVQLADLLLATHPPARWVGPIGVRQDAAARAAAAFHRGIVDLEQGRSFAPQLIETLDHELMTALNPRSEDPLHLRPASE
ncbi:hypothetical protein [Tsukamurella pseudospumae]|uniref:hypothetical protein n=1 Tax=Tsukamurella pseudospumae TaxID=239498 RepID=UPI00111264F6|nr:hypothetical protein [Tsukamurella pseudospumae]